VGLASAFLGKPAVADDFRDNLFGLPMTVPFAHTL
jgi:hypothetical protein